MHSGDVFCIVDSRLQVTHPQSGVWASKDENEGKKSLNVVTMGKYLPFYPPKTDISQLRGTHFKYDI